jgi:hypothetical protein
MSNSKCQDPSSKKILKSKSQGEPGEGFIPSDLFGSWNLEACYLHKHFPFQRGLLLTLMSVRTT